MVESVHSFENRLGDRRLRSPFGKSFLLSDSGVVVLSAVLPGWFFFFFGKSPKRRPPKAQTPPFFTMNFAPLGIQFRPNFTAAPVWAALVLVMVSILKHVPNGIQFGGFRKVKTVQVLGKQFENLPIPTKLGTWWKHRREDCLEVSQFRDWQ